MPFKTLASLKFFKISMISGTTVYLFSWIQVIDLFSFAIKTLGTLGAGSVAIYSAVLFFRAEYKKIKTKKKEDL